MLLRRNLIPDGVGIGIVFFLVMGVLEKGVCQNSGIDSLAEQSLTKLLTLADKGNESACLDYYRSIFPLIRERSEILRDALYALFSTGNLEIAESLLRINPFYIYQHNELAMYYYFLGISQMLSPRGWPNFKEAEKTISRARTELRRSPAPDYGFQSDVENALGYLCMVARGESTDSLMRRVTIIRHDMIRQGIYHFRDALVYNPENEIARANLDTLYALLERAGMPIPGDPFARSILTGSGISLDSIDIDSLNDVSAISLLDYSLLPRNHQLVLRELQAYDEIILLIDLSGSMDDPVDLIPEATKYHVARELSLFLAINLRSTILLGALSVGRECDTRSMALHYPIGSVSREELTVKFASSPPVGHTPLNKRLRMTAGLFSTRQNRKLVFLMSDGMDTCGEIPDLCKTATQLAANDIDLSIFSFLYETLDDESRNIFSVYNCMVHPSRGRIYTIFQDGLQSEQVDYTPVSNNILVLPGMDTSILWGDHEKLYQFFIEGIEPAVTEILRLED